MAGPILERDWKYLGSIKDELLNEICSRILAKAAKIAAGAEKDQPHQRYLTLYRYIEKSDSIVGDCFNDWRRSTISNKILSLRHHHLLTDEHVKHMSENAQDWLQMLETNLKY
jgi:hypothetical protein